MDQGLKDFKVKTESYTQYNHFIDDFFYISLHDKIRESEQIVDFFGVSWCLLFPVEIPDNQLFVRNGDQFIAARPNDIIFCPPYSLFETRFPAGVNYKFISVTSCWPLAEGFSAPRLLNKKVDIEAITRSRESILIFIEEFREGLVLTEQIKPSGLAERFKRVIEQEYAKRISISQIAKQMNQSREVLTRAFTDAYNIGPKEYLNRLKLFEALMYINNRVPLKEVYKLVGYSDSSCLINNFKKTFGASPKKFSPISHGTGFNIINKL